MKLDFGKMFGLIIQLWNTGSLLYRRADSHSELISAVRCNESFIRSGSGSFSLDF